MRVGQNTLWLVKSDGRILGPFTDKAIIEGIRSREFRPVDEVAKSGGRWKYVREEATFAKAVEDARMGALQNSDETTRDAFTATPSQTVSLTDTSDPDELTEEISSASVHEAMYQSYDDINRGGRDRRSEPEAESYTYDQDPGILTKAQNSTRWIASLTAVLIFLTIAYVAFNQFIARPLQSQNQLDVNMTLAFDALDTGDYAEALNRFRRVYETNPDDRGIYTQLGVLEIQQGQQSVVGRRLLEKVQNWVGAEKKYVLTGLGLSYLKDNDYTQAKTFFEMALNSDPLFLPASINLGATALYTKDFQKANNHLQLAIKDGSVDGVEAMLLTESLLQIWKQESDRTYLLDARKNIENALGKNTPYQDHLLVAAAYVAVLLKDKDTATSYFKRFNDLPIEQVSKYKKDLFMYRDQVTWQKLGQWCLEAGLALDPSSEMLAAQAKCLFLSGDMLGANQKIEQAIEQTPRSSSVQAIYADLLMHMNSQDKARVAVEKALDFDKAEEFNLPIIMQAEYCYGQKDYFCSLKYWQNLMRKDPGSIEAIAGIGLSHFADGHFEDARRYLAMGKRSRPNYIPILQLQKMLDRLDKKRSF